MKKSVIIALVVLLSPFMGFGQSAVDSTYMKVATFDSVTGRLRGIPLNTIVGDTIFSHIQQRPLPWDKLIIYKPYDKSVANYAGTRATAKNLSCVITAAADSFKVGVGALDIRVNGRLDSLSAITACSTFTVSAWCQVTKDTGAVRGIFNSDADSTKGILLTLRADSTLMFITGAETLSTTTKFKKSSKWFHVCATYRRSSVTDSTKALYVNGLLVASSSTHNPPVNAAAYFAGPMVGAVGGGTSVRSWIGQIDEFMFFRDAALTAAEVWQLYLNGHLANLMITNRFASVIDSLDTAGAISGTIVTNADDSVRIKIGGSWKTIETHSVIH